MSATDAVLDWIGRGIARQLNHTKSGYQPFTHSSAATLRSVLEPADVILIAGKRKLSTAIKYLTQSTWSHAALYVGDALGPTAPGQEPNTLVEVELGEGCIASPLSKYSTFNARICRPVGLSEAERQKVVRYMVERLGLQYDMRNILDLMRYLVPIPLVPTSWRRQLIALGSGDPTRAICSTMIAEAFQSVRYPILPDIEHSSDAGARNEILHIHHHSLFTPRDFDLSPYFNIVKPTIEDGFDYRSLTWGDESRPAKYRP
jgi:hypothetical protein